MLNAVRVLRVLNAYLSEEGKSGRLVSRPPST